MPSSISEILDRPRKNREQKQFLLSRYAKNIPDRIRQKLESLDRFGRQESEETQTALGREIRRLETLACVEAAGCRLLYHFLEVAGHMSAAEIQDIRQNPVVDVLLLKHRISSNKSAVKGLLRACVRGDRDWVLRQPANKKFLAELEEKGIDGAAWMSRFESTIRIDGMKHGPFRAYIETDPIEILQMGDYFGTCLKMGGINEWSVVANAVDLNKRVIYVRDNNDNVVARKLIAISTEFKLLGYAVYCAVKPDAAAAFVRAAVDEYARQFARACHLECADDGEVKLLVADDWYDDGPADWLPSPSVSSAGIATRQHSDGRASSDDAARRTNADDRPAPRAIINVRAKRPHPREQLI